MRQPFSGAAVGELGSPPLGNPPRDALSPLPATRLEPSMPHFPFPFFPGIYTCWRGAWWEPDPEAFQDSRGLEPGLCEPDLGLQRGGALSKNQCFPSSAVPLSCFQVAITRAKLLHDCSRKWQEAPVPFSEMLQLQMSQSPLLAVVCS